MLSIQDIVLDTYVDRCLQIADIKDVRNRVEVESWIVLVKVLFLIILIIEDKEFLPVDVENGALMGVGCSNVRSPGKNDWFCLIAGIVASYCQYI